jgi:type VI secretion system secreted protein VgrG
MAAAASQEKRLAVLTTPLGKDALLLAGLEATEGLSELFEIRIDAVSEDGALDFNAALGRNAAVEVACPDEITRYFNGIATEAETLGTSGRYHAYRLVLRPWLWLLSQRANCRIFDKTVVPRTTAPEIIKKVFTDAGFNDFRENLSQSYPVLEYCVQYRETDLSFVCRLMEENGIYYYFEHSADKHTLVMADATLAHQPIPGLDAVRFAIETSAPPWRDQHLTRWSGERRFRTGKVSLNDYDYRQPGTKLLSDSEKPGGYARASFEAYDYPGRYIDPGEGERLAKVRVEAEQALDYRRYALGFAPSLYPGGTVRLTGHPSDDGQYLVVRSACRLAQQTYASDGAGLDEWSGRYELQPKDRQYRAPQTTPRPVVHGPQTAKVVGKQGEEIDVDEHGRILVQFYWDRDKRPSRRVRVAQMWSGKTWGGQFIPRINMEVVIEHLEGDPDQPLVVGTVYNGDNKFPYAMPDKKNRAGLKSESTKNGSGHYNELYFDDTKGSDEIHMQAERDYTAIIKNTSTTTIATAFQGFTGDAARTVEIKNGNDVLTIDQGSQAVTIQRDQTTTLKEGNQTTTLDQGNQSTSVNMGKIETEAMQSIELVVGQNSIKIDQEGVTITGMMISIDGKIQTKVNGLVTEVSADSMLSVRGSLVQIN